MIITYIILHDILYPMMKNWLALSFLALMSLSGMSFLIAWIVRKGYATTAFVLFGIGVVFTTVYSLQSFVFSETVTPRPAFFTIFLVLIIGLLSAAGNFFLFEASKYAPNPGLATAVGSGMQAVVVTLLSWLILKDKITFQQFIGILLACASAFLIISGRK